MRGPRPSPESIEFQLGPAVADPVDRIIWMQAAELLRWRPIGDYPMAADAARDGRQARGCGPGQLVRPMWS